MDRDKRRAPSPRKQAWTCGRGWHWRSGAERMGYATGLRANEPREVI